jgi:hypothetical protein
VQKDIDDLTVFFTLSGSAHAKAALKTLMKLTRGFFDHEQDKFSDKRPRITMDASIFA